MVGIVELPFPMRLEILVQVAHVGGSFLEDLDVGFVLEDGIVLEFALDRVLGILAKEVQDTISMSLTHLLAGEEPMFPLTFRGEVDSSPNRFP